MGLKSGDKVKITDANHIYYGCTGTICSVHPPPSQDNIFVIEILYWASVNTINCPPSCWCTAYSWMLEKQTGPDEHIDLGEFDKEW